MRNRDDFSSKVKQTLAHRAGYLCSNPKCKKPTSGPHANINKYVNIGVAAHITAAAPGGKRYDHNLSHSARESIENGIWLCQSCSKLIDSDELTYTKDIIIEWKYLIEKDILRKLETNTTSISSSADIIEFANIKIIPNKTWKEISENEHFNVFKEPKKTFNRFDLNSVDPHFDIVIINNSDKNIIINKLGFTLRGIVNYEEGFGGSEYIEISKHKDFEIIVPDFNFEIIKILEAKENGNLKSYNSNLIVETNEDFAGTEFENILFYRINNINIRTFLELDNPIHIKSNVSYRYGLVLKEFDLYQQSKICFDVGTNHGIFSSDDIIIDLVPNFE